MSQHILGIFNRMHLRRKACLALEYGIDDYGYQPSSGPVKFILKYKPATTYVRCIRIMHENKTILQQQ